MTNVDPYRDRAFRCIFLSLHFSATSSMCCQSSRLVKAFSHHLHQPNSTARAFRASHPFPFDCILTVVVGICLAVVGPFFSISPSWRNRSFTRANAPEGAIFGVVEIHSYGVQRSWKRQLGCYREMYSQQHALVGAAFPRYGVEAGM